MIIAIAIMAIIMGPLAAAMVIGFNTVTASSQRLSNSADRQLASVYFSRDVTSSQSATTSGAASCSGSSTNFVVALKWNEVAASGTPPTTVVSATEADYLLQSGPIQSNVATDELVRKIYTGSPCTLETTQIVAYDLKSSSSAASASYNSTTRLVTLTLTDSTNNSYSIDAEERS